MIWRIRCAVIYSDGGGGDGGRVTKYEARVRLLGTVFLATDACPWHICTCVQCIYVYIYKFHLCQCVCAFCVYRSTTMGYRGPPSRGLQSTFSATRQRVYAQVLQYILYELVQTRPVPTAPRTCMCQNNITILSANNWRARV